MFFRRRKRRIQSMKLPPLSGRNYLIAFDTNPKTWHETEHQWIFHMAANAKPYHRIEVWTDGTMVLRLDHPPLDVV